MRRVTLLVCGEPLRGDDGVARAVLEALPPSTLRLADVRHVDGLMPDDLLGTDGPLIVLDAVTGPPAGEVIDLPLDGLVGGGASGFVPASSHALPLPMVLAIAERIGGSLRPGRFIGVAGVAYGIGAGLSAAVEAAVPRCAARLHHWIRVLAHESRASRPIPTLPDGTGLAAREAGTLG